MSEPNPPLRAHELGGWDLEVQLRDLSHPIDFAALFGRVAPVELELGFGSGLFLATDSMARPGVDFIGVENEFSQVRRTADKLRRRGVANVRVVRCDGLYFLEDYVAAGSISVCHIYFPDPWPKKRHHKRRIFSERMLPLLERALKPGGILRVKTDVTEYYDVIAPLLDSAPFLRRLADERLDQAPRAGDIVTNFQQKAIKAGHPIHAMTYERIAP